MVLFHLFVSSLSAILTQTHVSTLETLILTLEAHFFRFITLSSSSSLLLLLLLLLLYS